MICEINFVSVAHLHGFLASPEPEMLQRLQTLNLGCWILIWSQHSYWQWGGSEHYATHKLPKQPWWCSPHWDWYDVHIFSTWLPKFQRNFPQCVLHVRGGSWIWPCHQEGACNHPGKDAWFWPSMGKLHLPLWHMAWVLVVVLLVKVLVLGMVNALHTKPCRNCLLVERPHHYCDHKRLHQSK